MSVVISYASTRIAFIMSDGRVIDGENNVVQEDFKKFVRLNNNVIVGFTGDLNACICVTGLLSNPKNREIVSRMLVEDVYEFIRKYCTTFDGNIKYGFTICGKSKRGTMAMASMNWQQDSGISYVEGTESYYTTLYPEEANGSRVFEDNLKSLPPIAAAIQTIKAISKVSHSVNDQPQLEIVFPARQTK